MCVVHLASSLWYKIGCYSQLSNVDIVYLVKQTQRMIKMSVSAMSYELLLRDMVIEVSKFEYSKHIVNQVCYGVLARWLEVANHVCAVHVIQGTSTHQRCTQSKVNKRLKFTLCLITHNIY